METTVPEDIVQFIRDCIDRLGTLEVLLLLQSDPAKKRSAREISDELRSSPLAVQLSLDVLCASGLASVAADGYCFQPRTAQLEEMSRRLSSCYRERRAAVIAVIFSRPGDAVRSFAEAFRIGKGRTDG